MENEDCNAIHDSTGEWINVDVYDTLEDSCMSTSQGDRRTFGQSVKETSREYYLFIIYLFTNNCTTSTI